MDSLVKRNSGGNATVEQVLNGRTFTNDKGKQIGSMPNRDSVNVILSPGESYTIPKGYHDGTGKIVAASPFTEVKKATSSSHYSVDLNVDSAYLSNILVTKLVLYSSSRSRTGDSFVRISFKTEDGDTFTNVVTGSSGTLKNGIGYTWTNQNNGATITFNKGVKLTSLSAAAGSGVGQWRESDDVQITITGVR